MTKNSEFDPLAFFLESEDEGDDYRFLPPVREQVLMQPLIDGEETFMSMEEAILEAKDYVFLTLWYFQPATNLQSEKAKDKKIPPLPGMKKQNPRPLKTWLDLLEYITRVNGVEVRILLTDFDPVFSHHHPHAWIAYRAIKRIQNKLPKKDRSKCQVVCSLHSSKTGLIADRAKKRVNNVFKAIKEKKVSIKAKLTNRPGLWKYFSYSGKKGFQLRKDADFLAYPASHHQKSCIIDDLVAYCGGLDITTARLDNHKHNPGNKMSWHDIHCSVQGEIVKDLKRNFIGRWNHEMTPFQEFVESANEVRIKKGVTQLPNPEITELTDTGFQGRTFLSNSYAQMLRTLTEESSFYTTPSIIRNDIEKAYEKAINNATSFIYIENQYFRALEISKWLVDKSKDTPGLQLIIVLPVAPEEARMKVLDEATTHGLALQLESLNFLQDNFDGDIGIYSMVQNKPAKKKKLTNHCGSEMIYVHSKLLIIDDYYCMIGSPNANLRSFRVDTELAVGWVSVSDVKEFRIKLWLELLGSGIDFSKLEAKDFVELWDSVALGNKKVKKISPNTRKGFIVPHNINKFKNKAKKNNFFPDEFAELSSDEEAYIA